MNKTWKYLLPAVLIALASPSKADEAQKISYNIETAAVTSGGSHTPFWLVSNKHGLASLNPNNGYLSAGLFRDFDQTKGFTWAYGLELAGAWNHSAPLIVQQFYGDIKYNCWELSIGSKERWSEGKHRTLSGGGLTFAPNARPIPQVRFGINEYASAPWFFNRWVQVKGHLSYGWQTDGKFQKEWTQHGLPRTLYIQNVLFHEKTAFMRIANPTGKGLSFEGGLEMYTQFGGTTYRKEEDGSFQIKNDLPNTYKEYIKAFIPMAGGADTPEAEQTNINGNVLGSWHIIVGYSTDDWKLRTYYEHFYEDHSQLLGVSWVLDRYGTKKFLSYHPWQDGLWGIELDLPKGTWLTGVVAEFITSRDQSGPILHNSNNVFKEQVSGWDSYYNHYIYQSWQHWGMAMCNPQFLSPIYNDNSMAMPNNRLRSYHIGISGAPHAEWQYRALASYTRHWGSITDPLVHPMSATSLMLEATYSPIKHQGWQIEAALAADRSELIGNNLGGMLTLRKQGIFGK